MTPTTDQIERYEKYIFNQREKGYFKLRVSRNDQSVFFKWMLNNYPTCYTPNNDVILFNIVKKNKTMTYTATFQRSNIDQKYTKVLDCPSLEDATIEASTWAEDRGEELLSVTEG